MTRRAVDIAGQRYGRLVALTRADSRGGRATWVCRCDCGNEKIVAGDSLRMGNTRSCGCLRRETGIANAEHARRIGAMSRSGGRRYRLERALADVFRVEQPNTRIVRGTRY